MRYVRTRGMVETAESGKTTDFRSVLCRTHLPRMARATNSCTPRWFGRRTALVLLADFWYFWSRKSTIKEKWLYLKKTPHPSAYGCHLLPQSRRRRPRLLRKSVNSPLEKAGKMSWFRQRTCQTHARLALSAGVQTMRARICSTSSCAMFARVGT